MKLPTVVYDEAGNRYRVERSHVTQQGELFLAVSREPLGVNKLRRLAENRLQRYPNSGDCRARSTP